jgi:dipeptidyl aminopeptidase/acylaminoacyl peptidase
VAGVIDFFGPSDLLAMPGNVPGPENPPEKRATTRGARLLGGSVAEREILARQASPVFQVSAGDAPFLILHGDADPEVPVEQSERLEIALREAGVECKLLLFSGAGHGGAVFDSGAARQEVLAFLKRREPGTGQ